MKLLKADNYQTWYIEEENESILIDPWLTKQLQPDGKQKTGIWQNGKLQE